MFAKPTLLAAGLAVGLATFIPSQAEAHRRWVLPSATVLAGDAVTVSVDAAASNGLFTFDHRAMNLDDLVVQGPNGQNVQPKIIGSGEHRSVFEVPLSEQGTYRIAIASNGMAGVYTLNGERKRFRGGADQVPAGATDVRISQNNSRVETFVTLGAPTDDTLQPMGQGLEMVPVTHPNDLVAGEPAQVRFLLNGQPAAGLEIEFVEGGTRYRNDSGIQNLTTDGEGMLTLAVEEPGMYYIEAAQNTGGQDGEPGSAASYTAVLEFLPL